MLALLRTRRWLGFTAIVVLVIVAFGLLSRWQWHRAEEKRIEGSALTTRADAPPVPLSMTAPPPEWTVVEARGRFAPDSLMVRQRPQGGQNGAWVLSSLLTDAGRVWVSRGWLPVTGAAVELPALPAPPSGEVTVIGTWHPFEPVDPARMEGLPAGMVPAVGPPAIPEDGYAPGFVQASSPMDGLSAVAPPEVDDARNISYAIQWLLFATVAIVGWWFFLRREATEDAQERSAHEQLHA